MATISKRVAEVLEADCGYNTLAAIMEAKADEDVADLVKVLTDASEPDLRRQRAAFVLGRIGRKESVEPLAEVAPDLEEAGRIAVADALGRIGGAKARAELLKLSTDAAPQVRKFAANGLARIGDKAAMARLQEIAVEDAESFVRGVAQRRIRVSR